MIRDSSAYRKSDATKALPKFVGEYGSGYKISKHPRCCIKYFCSKNTTEENLLDALQFLQHLNDNPDVVVQPKKHDLEPGIQRCGYGYRVYYKNKQGVVITKRFTSTEYTSESNLISAKMELELLKQNDI